MGGVPPRTIYVNNVVGLLEISNRIPSDARRPSQEWGICFIALIAYFEAFCKDLFAAAVNIRPELLRSFREAGQNTVVDAVDLTDQGALASLRLGSLLAERIDLGSPAKINSVYQALVRCTPFGKKEAAQFAQFLALRNQLVHHGGIVTSKFARQAKRLVNPENIYFHSIVMDARVFSDAYNLFMIVSGTMVSRARKRIEEMTSELSLSVDSDRQKPTSQWHTDERDQNIFRSCFAPTPEMG